MIGASWGGLEAVGTVLEGLPDRVRQPIVVAQHRSPDSDAGLLGELLQRRTARRIVDPEDKTPLEPDCVYLAPPDYHALLEPGRLALSVDDPVHFARPSIDVLFESAADAYAERAVGVVLTGANDDGAAGLARIKARGGVAIVQDPEAAAQRRMPEAALKATAADAILPLAEIPKFLDGLCA